MVEPMSSVEPARHALYSVLQDVLGEQHADTLMTHLPQHPSDEVATKADVTGLKADITDLKASVDERFDRMDERLDRMDERFDRMEAGVDARFDRMEDRIDQLAVEVREMNGVMRDQLRTYSLGTIGAMTALTAIFSLVVTFLA
jgi:uncharacterized protein YdcH (DUF465 family)